MKKKTRCSPDEDSTVGRLHETLILRTAVGVRERAEEGLSSGFKNQWNVTRSTIFMMQNEW